MKMKIHTIFIIKGNKKMELTTEQINSILKSHGIDFSICGSFYIIKEDGEIVEQFFSKKINTVQKIRNWLGY